MFLALASAEDAKIKGGRGPVERTKLPNGHNMQSAAEYAKRRKALRPGGEVRKHIDELREKQAALRKRIETQAMEVVQEEMRSR